VRTKQRVARRRGLLGLVGILLGLVGVLGWRQLLQPRAGLPAPVAQLLLECYTPVLRAGGRVYAARQPAPPAPAGMTPAGAARLRALEEENRQLRGLLALRDRLPAGALAAEVTGRHAVPWLGLLTIDKGTRDGVAPRMVALAPAGVVGAVMTASSHSAQLLPLTDPACGIGAMLARTKVPGVLKGDRDGRCRLVYLPGTADVRPGDLVVTSGLGGIFPAGFPLGQVISVTSDRTLSSRAAVVQPAVELAAVTMVVLLRRK